MSFTITVHLLLATLFSLLVVTVALEKSELDKFSQNSVVSEGGDYHVIVSTGIPDHEYGPFPSTGNPYEVKADVMDWYIPSSPVVRDTPGCLGIGPNSPIAVAINGIPIFSPFTKNRENAVKGDARDEVDDCQGHPNKEGQYHYNQLSTCLLSDDEHARRDQLMGVALDGYPIYSPYDSNGNEIKSEDLDQCHGRLNNGFYEYRMTFDWPYVLGCFHGQQQRQPEPGTECVFAADYDFGDSSSGSIADDSAPSSHGSDSKGPKNGQGDPADQGSENGQGNGQGPQNGQDSQNDQGPHNDQGNGQGQGNGRGPQNGQGNDQGPQNGQGNGQGPQNGQGNGQGSQNGQGSHGRGSPKAGDQDTQQTEAHQHRPNRLRDILRTFKQYM